MTEDISNDRHPSSASIDIARLKERHDAMKSDLSDMRNRFRDDMGSVSSAIMEVKSILLAHVENTTERHTILLASFNQHKLEDAVVHTKVLQIDTHITATDTRLEEMNKRDPVTFWSAMTAAATAVGAVIYVILGGKQ